MSFGTLAPLLFAVSYLKPYTSANNIWTFLTYWPFNVFFRITQRNAWGWSMTILLLPFRTKNCKAGAQRCCAFYQPPQSVQLCWAKTISWAKPTHFDFSSSNCTVEDHILNTIGDALSQRWWIRTSSL